MSESVTFCLSPGTNNLFVPQGHNTTGEGGGTNIFASSGGGTNIVVGGSGGYDDVDEDINVSKASFLVSEVSKLSAVARTIK